MEQRLPENLYTRTMNAWIGFWPDWLRSLSCFYGAYRIAMGLTFLLQKQQSFISNQTLFWVMIVFLYIILKKISVAAWPNTTNVSGPKHYALLALVIISLLAIIINSEKHSTLSLKIEEKPKS